MFFNISFQVPRFKTKKSWTINRSAYPSFPVQSIRDGISLRKVDFTVKNDIITHCSCQISRIILLLLKVTPCSTRKNDYQQKNAKHRFECLLKSHFVLCALKFKRFDHWIELCTTDARNKSSGLSSVKVAGSCGCCVYTMLNWRFLMVKLCIIRKSLLEKYILTLTTRLYYIMTGKDISMFLAQNLFPPDMAYFLFFFFSSFNSHF